MIPPPAVMSEKVIDCIVHTAGEESRATDIPAACMTNAITSPVTKIAVNHLVGIGLRLSTSRYKINRPKVMYIDAAYSGGARRIMIVCIE